MESSRLVQRMLQGLGVPPRVVLLVLCDFLTLLACTLLLVCLRALWGGLDITSYGSPCFWWHRSWGWHWDFTEASRCLPM